MEPDEVDLSFGFYQQTCPQFEAIVHNKVKEWVHKDKTLAPSIMRLHFHDCAVRVGNIDRACITILTLTCAF